MERRQVEPGVTFQGALTYVMLMVGLVAMLWVGPWIDDTRNDWIVAMFVAVAWWGVATMSWGWLYPTLSPAALEVIRGRQALFLWWTAFFLLMDRVREVRDEHGRAGEFVLIAGPLALGVLLATWKLNRNPLPTRTHEAIFTLGMIASVIFSGW